MASELDICNLALAHLGDDATVTALVPPDGSAQADHCVRFYPMARDAVISTHAWNFATRRIDLALLDTDELPATWQYAYAKPNLCLAAISVLAPVIPSVLNFPIGEFSTPALPGMPDDTETQPFVMEILSDGSEVVFTNVEDAVMRYVVSINDTTKFTPLVVLAIARLLASMLAGPIIKGTTGMKIEREQREIFEKIDLPRAQAADARARKVNVYDTFVPDGLRSRL